MVKKLVLLLIICSSWAFAALQYLTKSIVPQTAFEDVATNWVEDLHSSGSARDDGIDQGVPLGFTFRFNGTDYTEVDIDSNGYLVFGNDPRSVYTNATLPQTDKDQSIYPYWDDLNLANGGTLKYDTLGSGENIHFVVSWEIVPQYPSNGLYSLQVALYKNGDIRFRYDATSSVDGASATVGVQENSNNYDAHSYNSGASFDASKDILYTFLSAKLAMSKTSCTISDLINGTNNPKRIPGATIRYALEVNNTGVLAAEDVLVNDSVESKFDVTSIQNLQIQQGRCDCLGVSSSSSNGVNGSANGVNPILLDFGDIAGTNDPTIPVFECGYFEVDLL